MQKPSVYIDKTQIGAISGCFALIFLGSLIMVHAAWGTIYGTHLLDKSTLRKTSGRIVRSSMVEAGTWRSRRRFHSIVFAYRVTGRDYTSDRVSLQGIEDPETYVRKYPVGKDVDVYYELGNPSYAVLETETDRPDNSVLYLPVLFASCAVGFGIWAWQYKEAKAQSES